MTKQQPIAGWWFSKDYNLPHGDNRIIQLGATHEIKKQLAICKTGLHASRKIIDALSYAPGPIIWKVELSGEIIEEDDKLCASHRAYLSGGLDCTEVMRKFSRLCALDVIENWQAPPVVIEYLKTGAESLRSAAWEAARSAAWDAAWDASGSAPNAAWHASNASIAARDASGSAAGSAAGSASNWDAAWDAARAAQNIRLEKLINELIEKEPNQ